MLKQILTLSLAVASFSAYADLKSDLLAMSDQDLWRAGRTGGIGKCYIGRSVGNGNACDYYMKTSKWGNSQPYNGLPLKNGVPYGSGCLVASSASMTNPALPPDIRETQSKNVTTCWGAPNTYPNWNATSTPICTADHVKNAANMLRNALNESGDTCDLASVVPPTNQAADTSSELLSSGGIKFDNLLAGGSPSKCWRIAGGAKVGGSFVAKELKPRLCLKLRRRAMAKLGPNAFLPTMSLNNPDHWISIALGKLTAVQIQDIFHIEYMTVNNTALKALEALQVADTSGMDATALAAHEAAMLVEAQKIKELTDQQRKDAIYRAIGYNPNGNG